MKKPLFPDRADRIISYGLLVMKYSSLNFFIAACLCSVSSAGISYGQKTLDKPVTLTLINEPFDQALAKIAAHTDVKFAYSENSIRQSSLVTLHVSDQKLGIVLEQLLLPRQLTFTVIENTIILKKKTRDPEKAPLLLYDARITAALKPLVPSARRPRQLFDVKGEVRDETGQPLPGVTVSVKGTTRGTATNIDGSYTLEDLPKDAILVFSFIGYQSREIALSGREIINVVLEPDIAGLDQVVVVGYGTRKKSDLTGSVARLEGETFKNQAPTQLTEMLSGTVAGFSANQGTSPAGGSSMEVRGPNSMEANSSPMIVLDGVIYNGSLRDINPADIESIDILKDASSAAIFGAKAASGVVLVNTHKGKTGKPIITFSTRFGLARPTRERRAYGPDEYRQFRADYFRTINPEQHYHFYTNPDELPADISIEDWRSMSPNPLPDNVDEYLTRLKFFQIEQEQYKAGQTVDWYDVVMRNGLRQTHDLSIAGGSDRSSYYFSLGYVDNEGLRVGEDYSAIRSRLNVDFQIAEWLSAGVNAQFADRDEGGRPASLDFYANSPYGREYDPEGNIERLAHGHTFHPLVEHYLRTRTRKINSLFTNLYADVTLPFGIQYRLSFQPRYETRKDMQFRSTDVRYGGDPNQDQSQASREEYSRQEWILDNILKWNKDIGKHNFDVTLLLSSEKSRRWSTLQENRNFSPGEQLGFHGMQFGDSPSISSADSVYTGDALMARLNYTLAEKYLFTGSIRRDGFSAFGQEQPRAIFPAAAIAWQVSREDFYNEDWFVNRLKLRFSWGVNGNRDIGIYAALARLGPDMWFDGSTPRVGLSTSSLANPGLVWERTESVNLGVDMGLLEDRIDLSLDIYRSTTTNLLMERRLPALTGFTDVTTNLGALSNRGVEMTLRSVNINSSRLNWQTNFVFSLNRNKIKALFGDMGEYTLLGETLTGELPDYTNQWFPGRAIDAVWDYELIGVWQQDEAEEAAKYIMRPGDFKSVDVNQDAVYRAEDDKQFIGYLQPRYRLGLGNEFSVWGNWFLSVFLRADLGHIRAEPGALNPGNESNDRRSRNVGPLPYWTPENPINEYARLDLHTGGYGGGIEIYRPRSFLRVQDISVSYNVPPEISKRLSINSLRIFGSVRNFATFTKWPHWDPESGTTPMPKTYTLGLSLSL